MIFIGHEILLSRCGLNMIPHLPFLIVCLLSSLTVTLVPGSAQTPCDHYFGIRVVDSETGRGVPLVELETVNRIRYITDSAGWVAMDEPAFMNQEVFFHVRSHGYKFEQDGFGFAGTKVQVTPGGRITLKIRRINIAERLYRITGAGIYRDSQLLGETVPQTATVRPPGGVLGQDSAFAVPYRGQMFWFWGDTSRMSYPLGQFWMSGAISPLPADATTNIQEGIELNYFVDENRFSKPMARLGVKEGVIWADGFLTLKDPQGSERLLCRYAHMASLEKMLTHGLAVYDDEAEEFRILKSLDGVSPERFPAQAHPFRHTTEGREYFYFGETFPNVRVQANWNDYINPDAWEAFSCIDPNEETKVMRDSDGNLRYQWQAGGNPVGVAIENKLLQQGLIEKNELRFHPVDVANGQTIKLHRGSVAWNPFRNRWILIAGQVAGASHLGEIYYAESDSLEGPWSKAIKIISHDHYSFYNPVHHPEFDQQGGEIIYLEGTYTESFSGAPLATPRYDYNQILYRLNLSDARLSDLTK
jgi:hypothetical protein